MSENPPSNATSIAARFVEARLDAAPLAAFPGGAPQTMAEAYAIQDAAIALWPGEIAGWKIGLVPPEHREACGEARIAGPIFREHVWFARGDEIVEAPVFPGGFAAVEAEIVFRLARDAPAGRTRWSHAEAAASVAAAHVGVEIASSPLASINDLGPAVTASDFGNNAGLVIGPAIRNWASIPWTLMTAEMTIDAREAGKGAAAMVPGGPLAALCFILGHCAARGRPLREGNWISTGATTGVHLIKPGETARAEFGAFGRVICRAARAEPRARGPISALGA